MTHLCYNHFGVASGHPKLTFFVPDIQLQADWMFLSTCPRCTFFVPHSVVIKCISITLWILCERPAHVSSSLWFAVHDHSAIGSQAELCPALSNSLSTSDVPSPNHGWLSTRDTKAKAIWIRSLVPLPPCPNKTSSWETCVLTKTGHSNFSRNANKRGPSVTGLNHDLGFTELAGCWLCFSIYLHNCSACYRHSRSRSE